MAEEKELELAPKKGSKPEPKADKLPDLLFTGAPEGRSIVMVPEDLNEKRESTEALQEALQARPGSRLPRVFTSLDLRRLDSTFTIYAACMIKKRGQEPTFKITKGVKFADFLFEGEQESIGDDVDFGIAPEPVKVIDLGKIVDSLQKQIGPSFRVAYRADEGKLRLLNT